MQQQCSGICPLKKQLMDRIVKEAGRYNRLLQEIAGVERQDSDNGILFVRKCYGKPDQQKEMKLHGGTRFWNQLQITFSHSGWRKI